jgi:hypothetical protein
MISRVPCPNCRGGVIRLAIAGNAKNDGHLSPWQEAFQQLWLARDLSGFRSS